MCPLYALIEKMDTHQDDYYIDCILDGDTSAYAFLVDKYQHMAYTIALRVLRNDEDAEDAAQESFVKVFQQLRGFERKSKFSTWLYTIVYRTAIYKRKQRKDLFFSIDENTDEQFDTNSLHVYDDLHQRDENQHVRQAIAKLPQTESVLVTLYYINENSIQEIRDITGLSTPNIKIRLFRARKKLERELHYLLNPESQTYEKKK